MIRKIILGAIILALPILANAQHKWDSDEIKASKVTYLTQKLELSTEEAKTFWPIYNNRQKELDKLREDRYNKIISFRKIQDIDNIPAKDVEAMINFEFTCRQRELDIERRYLAKFKTVLPMHKIGKFYRAQESFKREMLKRYQGKGDSN